MSRIPTVAIVGRPNTGKSTLFNRLVGKRLAIVSEIPGTTRDLVARTVETPALDYLLLDTGGIGGGSSDHDLEDDVAAQSLLALAHADLILFTVDAKEELTGSDYATVDILRKKRRRHVPVLLVLTKCDRQDLADSLLPSCYAFGIAEEIFPLSALHNLGIDKLRHAIIDNLRKLHFEKTPQGDTSAVPRIAIIGKPNVGKSSLVNALMSPADRKTSPRLISEVPGTTRDASDTLVQREGKTYTLVDTAGIRRRANDDRGIEWYANLRSIQAIADGDVAVLVLDAIEGVTRQDKRIARLALDEGKGLIILINKIDAVPFGERDPSLQRIAAELPFCAFCPFLAVSAKNGTGLSKLFSWIDVVARNLRCRIPTRELHRWYESIAHGDVAAKLSSVKHLTQGKDIPPTFILFTHTLKSISLSDLRYLEKRLRSTFAFEGTPIRWVTKEG
ncbi:ribosome biogenesis GTPase Der [Candidatus Peribacteria bacterium RIFCSPLOWO2_12_FULL_55_15]|nr:MAG: ribosome biogenesis GTPase Der [Candidatus Peribacteria bacterium RIFCSPHIGHO2_01_FULL_54_22]OGJ63082.1 MAG: ribosome biogenesis GTPase Der [Candidatus Peribacteria bacterium RIFCSPHIGHO2_02_FULL_55_24]OGJ68131.1 MAG: ribosome biogenesis GTPase Der [Candidatus Peribacteria bacterium RIFCSPLOWO2_01_FULL_54_110]OGJ70146.1 MAG: ribosome biogenesis GTPase Der [Candidatus Peribacteria bacterium RIFCSPLOWO2_02_FULL_55_36]OGJ71645.1 MAG: ribosome biogenesis GTPase Der [Candidatus Peribacteria 